MACFAVAALTAGLCSCATPYRPLKEGAGYSDAEIAPDQFRVSFQGDANTSLEQVNDFALLRAAELTREHNFKFFAVIDTTNLSSVKQYTIPGQMHRVESRMPSPPGNPMAGRPEIYEVAQYPARQGLYCKPGTSLLIKCFAEKPGRIFTFEAGALDQSLRQKYRLRAAS